MVSEADNGVQAMEAVENLKPDIILLELMMPGMGAPSVCKLLEIDPGIKVVIASGYTPDDNTMKIIQRNTRGYLRKPYFGKQLLQTVRSVLHSH